MRSLFRIVPLDPGGQAKRVVDGSCKVLRSLGVAGGEFSFFVGRAKNPASLHAATGEKHRLYGAPVVAAGLPWALGRQAQVL